MTIHADWIALFKDWAPEAFTPTFRAGDPSTPEYGFIDAQIKLMGMPRPENGAPPSWDIFLAAQFVRPIQQLWAMGARTVVLAFDDYEHVPKGKAITQAARRRNLVPFPFAADDPLPDFPPEPWAPAMANRAFKARVQQLIVESMPRLLFPTSASSPHPKPTPPPFRLLIDWRGPTLIDYAWRGSDGAFLSASEAQMRARIGEADIKFAHWAKTLILPAEDLDPALQQMIPPGNDEDYDEDDDDATTTDGEHTTDDDTTPAPWPPELDVSPPAHHHHRAHTPPPPRVPPFAVHATDGDFLPIGLLLPDIIDVSVYRFECMPPRTQRTTAAAGAAAKHKRPRQETPPLTRGEEEEEQDEADPATAITATITTTTTGGHPYEWVHIPTLKDALRKVVGTDLSPLIVLIALTGTDYSRTLPGIGPKTLLARTGLQSALRLARQCLYLREHSTLRDIYTECCPPQVRLLAPRLAMDSLVAALYSDTYARHLNLAAAAPTSYAGVLAALRRPGSALAERTRARLPGPAQVLTTLRNANFLLLYWRGHGADSLRPSAFGFRADPETGTVEWDDDPAENGWP